MARKPTAIEEAVRYLKVNPAFSILQEYMEGELAEAREQYENSEANEFLRGRVSILKKLVNDLRK